MPLPLDQIPPPEDVLGNKDTDADVDYGAELGFLAYKTKELEVASQAHELEVKVFMLGMRKIFAILLFVLCSAWLVFIGWVVWTAGKGITWNCDKFELSDAVLIALITTTTLNVLGLFFAVTRWLFPNLANEKDKA